MPQTKPGRPKKLDQKKRAEVCALVSAGVTVREAARFVGCDRVTIFNETQRNHEFRRDLEHARSQAQVHPLKTMHEAAAKNWRAAAWWLERLSPDSFTHPAGAVLGQREANKFARDLVEIIDRTVTHPLERERLFELIGAALPAAMRRTWDHRQSHRKLDQAKVFFTRRPDRSADTGPAAPSSAPEPPEDKEVERVLSRLHNQFQHMAGRVRQASSTATGQSAAAKNPHSPDDNLTPPVKNDADTSTHRSKTGR